MFALGRFSPPTCSSLARNGSGSILSCRRHFHLKLRFAWDLAAFGALLFAYVSFYAKFAYWSGDTAWGDRYVATTAQLVALMAVPLLLRHRAELGKVVWRAG